MALTLVLTITAVVTVLFFSLLTLPQWFSRSAHRHRMWRLRDELADDIIAGRLPADHPAVIDLRRRVQRSVRLASHISLVRLSLAAYVARDISRGLEDELLRRDGGTVCPTDGMSSNQVTMLSDYRERIDLLRTGTVLLGSWLGMSVVLYKLPHAIREAHRLGGADRTSDAFNMATDDAAIDTRFGRAGKRAVEACDLATAMPLRAAIPA